MLHPEWTELRRMPKHRGIGVILTRRQLEAIDMRLARRVLDGSPAKRLTRSEFIRLAIDIAPASDTTGATRCNVSKEETQDG